jgi:3,4-dihydroxy 2-butanone 4-phosphate synthase/GTP cyclohydrolase II
MGMKLMVNHVNDCILSLKKGDMVLLVDDFMDGREIGYFYLLSEHVTPKHINVMARHARGLISVALTKQRAIELHLPMMVEGDGNQIKNFTVSVDYENTTTGISAYERSETIQALIGKDTLPTDFKRPGHVFPLVSSDRGLIEKAGIAEAAIDLAKLCSSTSLSGVFCEVLNEKGAIANLLELKDKAIEVNLKMLSMKDLLDYRKKNMTLINRQMEFSLPTKYGDFQTIIYTNQIDESEYIVMIEESRNRLSLLPVYIDSGYSIGEAFEAERLEWIAKNGMCALIYRKINNSKDKICEKKNSISVENEWDDIVVDQILKDINITNSVIMNNVSLL